MLPELCIATHRHTQFSEGVFALNVINSFLAIWCGSFNMSVIIISQAFKFICIQLCFIRIQSLINSVQVSLQSMNITSSSSVILPRTRESSAKLDADDVSTFSFISPMIRMRNSKGPMTDPWGTPEITCSVSDFASLTWTIWHLLVRNECFQ